jgi:hypothetical protein
MADDVRLNIVLEDDGEPAQRPQLPEEGGTPGQPAKLEGETPEEERASQEGETKERSSTWLEKIKTAAGMLEGAASRLERFTVPLVNNDFMGSFREAANAAAEGLTKLGPYGQAAGVALQSVTGVVESFASVVNSFIERGKQLAQFSPELAMSGARAEMRSMMADMREAQELGPGISRMQDAQSELMTMLRDTLLPLKKWIVETLAAMMEALVKLARDGYIVAGDIYDQLVEMPGLMHDRMLFLTNKIQNTLDNLWARAQRRRAEVATPKDDPLNDLVDRAMAEIMGRAVEVPARVDPVLGAAFP